MSPVPHSADSAPSAAFATRDRGQLHALVDASRALYGTLAHTLYCVFRGRKEPGALVRQMYEIGNRSLVFVSVVMGFIGMILVFQGGYRPSVWCRTCPGSAPRFWRFWCAIYRRRSAR